MIKDIRELSNSYKFSENLIVSEKLDMFYFKIIINEFNITVLSHNHKIISKSDILINDMWENVFDFIDNEIKPKQNKILEKYGAVIIGFFYCPTQMPLKINYYNFLNVGIKNKEYTIGNIKSIISKKNIDIIKFCKDVNLLNIRGIGGGPIIVYSDEFKNILYDYIDNGNKDLLLNYMNNNMKSFSGNKFSDIEGLIINDNGNIFQIKINDDISHDIGNFAAYERFILAFIKFWKKYDIPNFKNKSYIGIINKIFLDFIEFNDVKFEDFELVPPGNCYIGDLCYKLINDLTVETMCRINKLYKNIYRILFKSLKRYKKYNANFYYLTEDDIKYWNFIIDEITAYLK